MIITAYVSKSSLPEDQVSEAKHSTIKHKVDPLVNGSVLGEGEVEVRLTGRHGITHTLPVETR